MCRCAIWLRFKRYVIDQTAKETNMGNDRANGLDRRKFLERSAAGVGVASVLGAPASGAHTEAPVAKSIRVGVIGVGPRGQWHVRNLLANHSDVTIPAICDIRTDRLQAAIGMASRWANAGMS